MHEDHVGNQKGLSELEQRANLLRGALLGLDFGGGLSVVLFGALALGGGHVQRVFAPWYGMLG